MRDLLFDVAVIVVSLFLLLDVSHARGTVEEDDGGVRTTQYNRHHWDRPHHKHAGHGEHNLPRCGEAGDPISDMRPCPEDDSYCGHWVGRFWHPVGCRYDDVTSEQARKCLGNRTLAFMGDSMIRDVCVGVVSLLLGQTLEDAPSDKFDYKHDLDTNGTRMPETFESWNRNVPGHNYNGYVFPQQAVAERDGHQWQVQMWNLYCNQFHGDRQAFKVFNNEMRKEMPSLRKIDLGFWNHGLHDWGWWDKPPHGEKFWWQLVAQWLRIKDEVEAPTVWLSMNSECFQKLNSALGGRMETQATMVTDANKYVSEKMKKEGLPYWDADQNLRTPKRCSVSDDGVHVKMFVDLMRAKMLFTILCDKDFNWRGSPDLFV